MLSRKNMNQKDIFASDQTISGGDLSGKYSQNWVEESIVVEEGSEKQLMSSGTNTFLGRSISFGVLKVFTTRI